MTFPVVSQNRLLQQSVSSCFVSLRPSQRLRRNVVTIHRAHPDKCPPDKCLHGQSFPLTNVYQDICLPGQMSGPGPVSDHGFCFVG